MSLDHRQTFQSDRKDGWASGIRFPAEQELCCGTADSTLARPHAAAGLELSLSPGCLGLELNEGDILTATRDRFRGRQTFQFIAEREGISHRICESLSLSSRRKKLFGVLVLPAGGITGNLAFHEGKLQAPNAGCFPCAVDGGDRSLLKVVYPYSVVLQIAAQQSSKLGMGYEMKSASQVITGNLPTLVSLAQRDAGELIVPLGRDRPATREVRNVL